MFQLQEEVETVATTMITTEPTSSVTLSASVAATLPLEYKPTSLDVLSGRRTGNNNHAGNLKFLSMVKKNLTQYMDAPSRIHKSVIIDDTLEKLLTLDLQFLKQHKQTRKWHILNRSASYKRVAHAFRDFKYKATKKNNNRRANKMNLQTIDTAVRAQPKTTVTAKSAGHNNTVTTRTTIARHEGAGEEFDAFPQN